MFGFTRRRRFEDAVLEEMAYMLDLHGLSPRAVEEARARARRPGLPGARVRVIQEAASRLADRLSREAARQRAPLAFRV